MSYITIRILDSQMDCIKILHELGHFIIITHPSGHPINLHQNNFEFGLTNNSLQNPVHKFRFSCFISFTNSSNTETKRTFFSINTITYVGTQLALAMIYYIFSIYLRNTKNIPSYHQINKKKLFFDIVYYINI